MDLENRIRQLKLQCLAETELRVSQEDSSIRKHSEEMEKVNKSLGGTRTQISELDAELAQLNKTLSDENRGEEDIKVSIKELSSRLGFVLAELGPFEKRLQTHQANLDTACYRKKRLSEKVPSTDIIKRIEAETDETISLENKEIDNLTQESKQLHGQVNDFQNKLKSGAVDLEQQRLKISIIKRDIRLCELKLTQAKSDEQSCLSQLKSVTEMLETARQNREELLKWKESTFDLRTFYSKGVGIAKVLRNHFS
ncbi:hypothetical protein CTI12_AA227120 [Artemisia annua]|uniref:Uncharacterized protein n=1 Tax=Artemisia annua TaxID=35608 RepID=A0A2U1NUW0_ARTAN|nr:hypothetical protein CTI12_AA227120 [Artemisia annua]